MAAQLAVRRLAMVARVPRDQRPIPGLTHDLGEMVQRLVTPRLSGALDRMLTDADSSVTLIRRLEVDLAISARWDAERIAAAIADAIAAAIRRALHDVTAAHVLPDRPAHLAAVLADVVAGTGRRWHHGAYAKAADRPRAEALATLLDGADADGLAALALVGPLVAASIVRALPDMAVTRLARDWNVAPNNRPPASAPTALHSMVHQAALGLPPDLAADQNRAALLLLARTVSEMPAASRDARTEAVRATLARPAGVSQVRASLAARSGHQAGNAPPLPDPSNARAAPSLRAASDAVPFATLSQNAALFLLWRSAIESGALAVAQEAGVGGPMALVRALAGPGRSPAADPAVGWLLRDATAEACDIPPLSLAEIWPAPTPLARAVLQTIDGALSCHVLIDAATGAWRGVWREQPDPAWFGDCALIDPAEAASLSPGRVATDLAGLALVAGDPETVLAWAWLAERVMRDFARRIPGFAHASVAWLRANLLPASALVRLRADGETTFVDVHLDPPPVGMLLRIAGLHATEYRLPGRPDRVVRLRMARV